MPVREEKTFEGLGSVIKGKENMFHFGWRWKVKVDIPCSMVKLLSERSQTEGSSTLEILIRQAEEADPVTTQDSLPSLGVEAKRVSHAPEG